MTVHVGAYCCRNHFVTTSSRIDIFKLLCQSRSSQNSETNVDPLFLMKRILVYTRDRINNYMYITSGDSGY